MQARNKNKNKKLPQITQIFIFISASVETLFSVLLKAKAKPFSFS